MENIDNLLQIYEQLRSCTNPDEVETLKERLKGSIHVKKRRKESDRDSCKNSGSKDSGYQNVGKSPMLSVANKSREVDNLIKEVKELAEIGKFGDDLTIEVHEEMQFEFPTSNLVGEKFDSYLNDISDLLIKHKASTIGVWGMGGVGKTTLIRHLHNMMLGQLHIYGSVYWITVSKDCSIQKLQTDIAESIRVSISNTLDEWKRARILAEALKRKKKFVLILDDMWSDFDLNEVGLGIPKEIGYRLIVTSRSKDICLKMYCDNIIKVDLLSKKDAWTLFVKSIGHEIPNDLIEVCTNVLKECAGLPLGIITLAKSMIGCNDVCEWRNVLEELRNASGKVDDMEEKVFKVLRLSYERLNDSEIKECLLYCATYPEDYRIRINELIWLFIDAGLLGKNVGMAKMLDKGLTILKKLERGALLSIEWKCVHLHDLIRDMALQIAGCRFMIKAGIGLKGIPDEESWTDQLEVVSLMKNEIEDIYDSSPKCNRLTTLLLMRNLPLSQVCDGFFRHLNELKVLELSDSKIRTLPLLKNLTALILRNCRELENIPSLAKLISLERLNLYRTSISQLPEGIGSLIKLKYLNLFSRKMRSIGVGVISKLTALEYLATIARIEVKELDSLKNLEHLSFMFEDFVNFSTFIEQMKIKRRPNSYEFLFEHRSSAFDNDSLDLIHDSLDLMNARLDSIDPISNQWGGKQIYLRNIPSLIWGDSNTRRLADRHNQLLNILFGNYYTNLKNLFSESQNNLQRSPEMERNLKVFCENELQKLLQDIHSLDIAGGGNLMSIGDFVFETTCNLQRQSKLGGPKPFSNLKRLRLYRCENMKKLVPLELLSNLQNIENIDIWRCQKLEELIESVADETKLRGIGHPQIFSLPKLSDIDLKDLPKLERICSDDKVIRTFSLQRIKIEGCEKLKRMPLDVDNQRQVFTEMEYKKKEKEWVESLEWDPPQSKSRLRFVEKLW